MSQSQPAEDRSTFLFDIIVTRLHLYKDNIADPANVEVNVRFNRIPVNITASRINVLDFQAGRRTEFMDDPEMLRISIEKEGLPVTVRYNGLTLGNAKITFPQSFIDRIQNGMSDLLHADTCQLVRRGMNVGILEVLCILFIKCDELTLGVEPCTKSYGNIGEVINLADILFVVGKPETCPPVCERCFDELEPEEGDELLKLDINRYRSSNQRAIESPQEICGMEACCQLKTLAGYYGEIIDSVVKKVAHSPSLNDNLVFTDWSGKQKTFKHKGIGNTIPVPFGETEDMGIKPIRFCPVCLTPMSWLPKYAPCPKCCINAVPQIDKSDEKLTADQIIQEFIELPSKSVTGFCVDPCGDRSNEKPKCVNRCTCTNGKLCAHCRIRNYCEDIFAPVGVSGGKCPKVMPNKNEDFCIIVEPNNISQTECRPNLECVFDELRDLYNKRDARKTPALKKSSLRIGYPSEDHIQQLTRKSYSPKIGHKTCLKKKETVPRRHGWAWPSTRKARKYGWRPGAIRRYAGTVMKFFLQCSQANNAFNTCRQAEEAGREQQLPILNVRKRNGSIYITLRAVNNRHVQMKPIVFRIVKSDLAVALREIKRKLKNKGFRKCTCHNTLMMCVCRNYMEKKHLEFALKKECKRRGMENCVNHLVLTDTSDSEMEFDFDVSPPTPVRKPQLAIKPRTVDMTTQTNKKDETAPRKYPFAFDPYWRTYDCAAGDRYTGTSFGLPGEYVFEDGLFGHAGGEPPGASVNRGSVRGGRSPGGVRGGRIGGIGGGMLGKSFPGAKNKSSGPSPPIPVRMPKRHVEAVKQAAKNEKQAIKDDIERKKKGIDLMQYLIKHGAVPKPWNPNEPQPEVKTKTGPVVGTDGLTDAQRKRRALNQICIPPFETLPRLGKGFDPCISQFHCPCPQWCDLCDCHW